MAAVLGGGILFPTLIILLLLFQHLRENVGSIRNIIVLRVQIPRNNIEYSQNVWYRYYTKSTPLTSTFF